MGEATSQAPGIGGGRQRGGDGTTGTGYLTVFPTPSDGSGPPLAANLNWTAGKTVPNLVEVAVGANGRISIFTVPAARPTSSLMSKATSASDHTPGRDGRFVPTVPARILDTRYGPAPSCGARPGTRRHLHQSESARRRRVPATGVGAVVLNVAVTNATSASHSPSFRRPCASTCCESQLRGRADRANRVIVRVARMEPFPSSTGSVRSMSSSMSTAGSAMTPTGSDRSGSRARFRPDPRYALRNGGSRSPIGKMSPHSTMSLPVAVGVMFQA